MSDVASAGGRKLGARRIRHNFSPHALHMHLRKYCVNVCETDC